MSERRFLVPPGELDAAGDGRALIRGTEHHHLRAVLRLRPGDEVSLFDGRGSGRLGEILAIGKTETTVTLLGPDPRAVEPAFRLTLAQGIPHHDKMDLIVQKSTELGVARIVPIVAHRSVPRAAGPAIGKRLERWRRVAAEAARQSGRLVVPDIAEPVDLDRFVLGLPPAGEEARLILAVSPDAGDTSTRLDRGALAGGGAVVAVGPEGGWAEEERAMAVESGFSAVSLGPRVLRTETAGIVATALVLYLAGEMEPRAGHCAE